ncbi:MAG: DUF975 family protein, partial [Muribaculaceae bacterium]|nr:DUF975 family protein [Muribaculaceae bacterium]
CIGFYLLVVPGIIAALGLSMTFFIMVDDPNISGLDALKKSWQMMKGHKTDYFLFCCRFIGWILICVLTFGLASFVVNPYFERAKWHYYRALVNGANDATSNPQPPVFLEK